MTRTEQIVFGKQLKEFRLNTLSMGMRRFAAFLGIKPSYLSNIEHGRDFEDTPEVEQILGKYTDGALSDD